MSYAATAFDPERHRQDLVRLLAENLPVGTPSEVEARVDWFYSQNPAGHPATAIGVHTESGEVVGCGSYYPRTLFVPMHGGASREIHAGILCDFGVTKAHRSAGAAISIQRALAKGSYDSGLSFLFGSPNDNALAIFKRIGYRHLGDSVTYVKPLRSRSFLEKRGAPSAIASAGALAGDPVLATRDLGLMLPSMLRLKGDTVRAPDGAFDDLWARARRDWVLGERSADFLRWRYGRAHGPPFEIFGLRTTTRTSTPAPRATRCSRTGATSRRGRMFWAWPARCPPRSSASRWRPPSAPA
jgi:hypothetical protein